MAITTGSVFDRWPATAYHAREMMTSARRPRGLTWILVLWLLVLGPFALFESFHAPLPQGVLDGDDDDGAVGAPTHPSVVAVDATIPSALPLPAPSSSGAVVPDAERPLLSAAIAPRPSRSPPIA